MALDFVQNQKIIFSSNNNMTDVYKKAFEILDKSKQSIPELSKVYRSMEEQGLKVTWMDVLKKDKRKGVKDRVEKKMMKGQVRGIRETEKKLKDDDKEIAELTKKIKQLQKQESDLTKQVARLRRKDKELEKDDKEIEETTRRLTVIKHKEIKNKQEERCA